jgi:hypothetical protein
MVEAQTIDASVLSRIDPAEIACIRREIKNLIERTGSLVGLVIEENKPPDGMLFAIVHETPKLSQIADHDKDFWYRCSYCERNKQFKNGKIVFCADKKLRLIGLNCWKNHIEEEAWSREKADWREFQRRTQFENLRGVIIPAAMELQRELKDVRTTHVAAFKFADDFRGSFASLFPELANALLLAIEKDLPLTIDRLIEHNNKREWHPVRVHTLQGKDALINSSAPLSQQVDTAFASIIRAVQEFREIDWESLSNQTYAQKMDIFLSRCRDAISFVESVNKKLSGIRIFLSVSNVTGIAKWANDDEHEFFYRKDKSGDFRAILRGIEFVPYRGDTLRISYPEDFQVIDVTNVDALKALITKF